MSKPGKPSKRKVKDSKLRQPLMGEFVSKTQTKATDKKVKKKRFEKMSSFIWTRGSYMDTEEYRNNYPGKKDRPNYDDNYLFYMNQIPSKPDGDFIDNIHARWWGDYTKLERHHGYIQWLFPIRDSGMNWHAQELQVHEIEKLTREKKAMKRLLKSYQMMLDFYGMKLVDEKDGTVERSEDFRSRFRNLNRSYHNYLRITRILKCLGELNYEHLKANFVRFVLYEGIVERTLPNAVDSCMKYWVGVIRSDQEREKILDYYDELCEREPKEEESSSEDEYSAYKISQYRKKKDKLLAEIPKKVPKKPVSDEEMSEEDTLEYAMNLVGTDSEDETDKKKEKKPVRKDHELSDSDEEFKTPEAGGDSMELAYWKQAEGSGKTSLTHGSDEIEDMMEDMDKTSGKGSGDSGKSDGQVGGAVDKKCKEPITECNVDKDKQIEEKKETETISEKKEKEDINVDSDNKEGDVEMSKGKGDAVFEEKSDKAINSEEGKANDNNKEDIKESQGTEKTDSVKEINPAEGAGTAMETDNAAADNNPVDNDTDKAIEDSSNSKRVKLDGTEEENGVEMEEVE